MAADSSPETAELEPPVELRKTLDRLRWQREQLQGELTTTDEKLEAAKIYLELADQVTEALDELSQTLFEQVLGRVARKAVDRHPRGVGPTGDVSSGRKF